MEPGDVSDPASVRETSSARPFEHKDFKTTTLAGFPTSSGAVLRKVTPRPNIITNRTVQPTDGLDPSATSITFKITAGHNEIIR